MATENTTELRITARVAHVQLQSLAGCAVEDRRLERLIEAVLLPIIERSKAGQLGDRLRAAFMLVHLGTNIIDLAAVAAVTEAVLNDIQQAWARPTRPE